MDELIEVLQRALEAGERVDLQFQSNGRTWVLSMAPKGE